MSKCIAFIQARMSSSRFPGKVLEELGGMPTIVFMVERARRARLLDQVVVVTSTDASDQPLADTLARHSIDCFRGDLDDVLARFAAAAARYQATEVMRLTGDCPLIDPAIIDRVIAARRGADAEYSSNIDPPSYPDGLDVEFCTRAALDRCAREARAQPEREHVTLWMRGEAAGLKRVNVRAIADCSSLRLTVDYPDDLAALRRLADLAGARFATLDFFELLRLLDTHREITDMNLHARNEGLARSLAEVAAKEASR
ncbi:MAG TPA: glycosyltransferase family protein [Steroidobacteraceae bacterium]|jgi:spore coat polysaccharide biosynthesis protein SpsF|nr:glycosyltransferase family protein [Steroidobacteraceae bacterium]